MRCRGPPLGWPTHQLATEVTVTARASSSPNRAARAETTLTVGSLTLAEREVLVPRVGGPEFIPDSPDGRTEAERLWRAGVR
jgi:hypothetical protein